jgi:hypothetical protein
VIYHVTVGTFSVVYSSVDPINTPYLSVLWMYVCVARGHPLACLRPTRATIWHLSSSGFFTFDPFTHFFLSFLACLDLPRPSQDCIFHPNLSLIIHGLLCHQEHFYPIFFAFFVFPSFSLVPPAPNLSQDLPSRPTSSLPTLSGQGSITTHQEDHPPSVFGVFRVFRSLRNRY